MSAPSSKLTALAGALVVTSLLLDAVRYLFELRSHPHLTAISFARAVAAHQWFG